MPNHAENKLVEQIAQAFLQDLDGIKPMIELLYNTIMRLERSHALGAEPYERSEERRGYANGFKDKKLKSRVGALDLQVPQARGIEFYPKCLEKGVRSERALVLTLAQMYVQGVSTRKLSAITKEMCGMEFTSTQVSRAAKELDEELEAFRNRRLGEIPYLFLDATYLKVRRGGHVRDAACLIAYGVNSEGKREIVGVSIQLSEAEVHWRTFLTSLVERGLKGVRLITSDDHAGLKQARRAILPSVPWQRCQFHLSQNAQSYAPSKSVQPEINRAMRNIFASATLESARYEIQSTVNKFTSLAPKFTNWLEENIEESLTVYNYPPEHRKRLRTTNGLERVNREIKRRTRVAVMFPNEESALRLVSAVLVEIHEEWITGKQYLNMELLYSKERQMI